MNVIYIGKAEDGILNRLKDHLSKFKGKSVIWQSWINNAFANERAGLRRITIDDIGVLCLSTKYPTIAENMLINVKTTKINIPLNVTDNTFKNELYTPEPLEHIRYGHHDGGIEIFIPQLKDILGFVASTGESVTKFWSGL